jgi:hypothetical protein
MLATDGTWREADDARHDEWRALVGPALWASVALLLAIAIFLCARRLDGAFSESLAPIPLVVTAGGLLAWAVALRLRLRDRRALWLGAVTLVLFAVGCSAPGGRAVDWVVWLAVLGAYVLLPGRRGSPAIGPDNLATVVQQLSRSRTADGCETIRGSLVAEFAARERAAVLHVAFCPSFERLPTVESEIAEGPACEVKLAQILHQGARFEARLARASTRPQRVTIEFVATDRRA